MSWVLLAMLIPNALSGRLCFLAIGGAILTNQFVVASGGAQGPTDRFRGVDRVGGISTYVSCRGSPGIITLQNLAVGPGLRYSGRL
jgi:hypothetical protein